MKNNTWTWIAVIGLILFGAFLYWGGERIFKPEKPVIISDTTTHQNLDTNKYVAKTKYILVKQKVDSQAIYFSFKAKEQIPLKPKDSVKTKTDSIKVFNDFYDTKFDSILLVDNPDLYFMLHFGITQNRLISADGKYVNKRITQNIINTPMQPLKNSLFFGGGLGANTDIFSLNCRITLETKKHTLYTPEIEYIPILSKHPIFKFSAQIKIW